MIWGFLILAISFIFVLKKVLGKKGFSSSALLILLYSVSFITSVILIITGITDANVKVVDYFSGCIYLLIALLIFLYPFISIEDNDIYYIKIPQGQIFKLLIFFTTVASLFSLVYYILPAYKMQTSGLADIAYLRSAVTTNNHPYITPGFVNGLAKLFAFFYNFQILIFFINILKDNRIKLWTWIVLISSFSYPVFVLAFMGRDGVLFWVLSFLSNYLLFYRYIPFSIRKKIKLYFNLLVLLFGIIFMMITIGRFIVYDHADNNSLIVPILSYLGQSAINFSEFFNIPLTDFKYMESFISWSDHDSFVLDMQFDKYNMVSWVFRTFVYDLFISFGPTFTILIGLVLILLYKKTFVNEKRKKTYSLSFFIVYILFYTIYSQGLFYFTLQHYLGFIYIISLLFISICLNYIPFRIVRLIKY